MKYIYTYIYRYIYTYTYHSLFYTYIYTYIYTYTSVTKYLKLTIVYIQVPTRYILKSCL